ncbi:usg protein [Acidisoma sp.]|uniref:usg protein n=1 Tax=Acidisoma sp. TaxID=1872115 RepID=UPI003B007F7C
MSLALQLRDYRLTTAEILYRLPDHPAVLQSYIWQDMDRAPDYPSLKKFLEFWSRELEGKLHSVRVGTAGKLIAPPQWRHVAHSLALH